MLCAYCRQPLPARHSRGPAPAYCSRACRQSAYRARQRQAARLELLGIAAQTITPVLVPVDTDSQVMQSIVGGARSPAPSSALAARRASSSPGAVSHRSQSPFGVRRLECRSLTPPATNSDRRMRRIGLTRCDQPGRQLGQFGSNWAGRKRRKGTTARSPAVRPGVESRAAAHNTLPCDRRSGKPRNVHTTDKSALATSRGSPQFEVPAPPVSGREPPRRRGRRQAAQARQEMRPASAR